MKNLYLAEVKRELARQPISQGEVITEKDLAPLPEPVQRFFRHCGYLGQCRMNQAEIVWQEVKFKSSPRAKWMKLNCYQFNSVLPPTRIVYMKSNLLGLFPLEGRDKYQDGQGHMLIKLLKYIPIADARGREMDASCLVTLLAECFLLPAYALQDYIKWTAVDEYCAQAELTYRDTTVSGLFFFNPQGEFTRFVTEDRYYSEKGGTYKKMKWSAVADNYREINGLRLPTFFKGIWHTEKGDYEYFQGSIKGVKTPQLELN
ncbi:DUF6544 family protein [Desulforamulus ferrireducens]|uniref:Uncharacterized protein n=1 Tax=Desulforamulus ferrireducens TaxID=1833852 RepID=A0A1S6IWQ7_9FIRM|nr:DUF6544 family protein [Desulforamulus ferrireducens]AQS59190.1 hypothetical protein B0537_08935 [Desulforamulus ferrireducens]